LTADSGGRPFLDLVSHARLGPGQRAQFSHSQLAQISRTVRGAPEVMVKVSGGGKSAKAVAAHFAYIGREQFQIETDDGEQIKGKESTRSLLDDWELDLDAAASRQTYRSTPGPRQVRLVHNVVLSMPAGSSPDGVLQASRDFAREQFAFKHRYALILHTDQPHPHVHLVVKAMGEQGQEAEHSQIHPAGLASGVCTAAACPRDRRECHRSGGPRHYPATPAGQYLSRHARWPIHTHARVRTGGCRCNAQRASTGRAWEGATIADATRHRGAVA
jgi:hypothetical protein